MTGDFLSGDRSDRLTAARDRFSGDFRDLCESVRLETGLEHRFSLKQLWPILALTAGLALGAGVWWRR